MIPLHQWYDIFYTLQHSQFNKLVHVIPCHWHGALDGTPGLEMSQMSPILESLVQ